MRAAAVAVALAALLCACVVDVPPFSCDEDAECGDTGRCEDDHACSFSDDACRGGRRYGEHGDADLAGRCVGDLSGAIVALAAGSDHTCARAADGRLWCWGDNQRGGLGRDDVDATPTPAALPTLGGVTDVDGGEYHTCAVAAGEVLCWGLDDLGQLGDGRDDGAARSIPQPAEGLSGIVDVDLGEGHACARDAAGDVWCWGSNGDRETGAPGNPSIITPRRLDDLPAADAIAAGGQVGCAIAGAEVWCWGRNDNGQLGVGDLTQHNRPLLVPDFAGATELAIGGDHTCALLGDGTVRCAGHNGNGQLGDGTRERRPAPVAVAGLTGVVQVVALDWANCARDGAGAVVCWGMGELGQLGEADDDRLAPAAPVPLPGPAVSLAGGESHACAQTDDGCVWCWGSNQRGQLGAGRDGSGVVRPVLLSCQ